MQYNNDMLTLMYIIDSKDIESELEWLRIQKVFPAVQDYFDFDNGSYKIKKRVGVIVNPEIAMAIKLRHNLNRQEVYRQK